MTALCLDTNTYTAYRKGTLDIVGILKAASHVWIPAIVLGELRFGFVNGNRNASNELILEQFLESPTVSVAVAGSPTSREYALLSHQLRIQGVPIPTNDIWIAACAIELDCPVLTFDAHFKRIEGLRVVGSEQDWIDLHT
jgi:predicted nucleic acid-binding protein